MGGNTKLKNGFVVVIIILFALLILEPGINANQVKTESKQLVVPSSYEDEIDRWAVIIGISDYKGSSADLPCPAKEAQELYDMLISKDSRWDMNNIQLLLNGAAAKNDILSALDWLIENAGEGDVVLFAYNGHGSFVKDDKWDELDRRDETIVTWELDDITDDTLSSKFNEISAKNIEGMFLIFDCCFSGGIIDWKMSMGEKSQLNENKKWLIKELSKSTMFTDELIADIKTKNRVVLASTIPRGIGLELRGPDGWFSFTRGIITALEKKRTMAEGICRYAKWWWLTNPTVIEVLFNPLLWYESFLYFIEEGIIIMPLPIWKDRYPRLSPMSKKLPIIGFCNVVSPIISDPSPEDGAQYISTNLTRISFHLKDYQDDLMDYTIETSPDIGSGGSTGVDEGTYSINIGGLDYSQEYKWFVNVTDGTNCNNKVFSFQTEPQMVFDPFNEGWEYRKKITINHSQVAGNLCNFPVLIVKGDSDFRDKAQENGDDILFMDDDGVANRLCHEIENYDSSTGTLIAWVNITNIASNQDTTFYIYYGNSICCNQQAPERVWDSNFAMIQHMYDSPDGAHLLDSTNNENDGEKKESNGPVEINGKIGKGENFDGIDDFIKIADSSSLDVSKVTLEAWIYIENYPGIYPRVISKDGYEDDHSGYHLITHEDNCIFFRIYDGNDWFGGNFDANALQTGSWIYIVGKYDGKTLNAYKNGVLQTTTYSRTGSITSGTDDLAIGTKMSRPDWTRYLFDGTIDEARVSNIARSNNWITTCYNTQNDPVSFLSFGVEETNS